MVPLMLMFRLAPASSVRLPLSVRMPVPPIGSPGLIAPPVVAIKATVPVPPRVAVEPVAGGPTATAPVVLSTSSAPAVTVEDRVPSLAAMTASPSPCFVRPDGAVITPPSDSDAPALSTFTVPAPWLKVIGRLIAELVGEPVPPCEASSVLARPIPFPVMVYPPAWTVSE